MSSITYRIATCAQAGRKVATLQTIPADADAPEADAGKVGGFSLHEKSWPHTSRGCPRRCGRLKALLDKAQAIGQLWLMVRRVERLVV